MVSLHFAQWTRQGDSYHNAARRKDGTYVRFEIVRQSGFDRLRGGDYVEWSLRIDEKWDETFPRLKDAKLRAMLRAAQKDYGADLSIEDHRKNCEPYIDDDALWEQHVHDKHVAQEDAMGVPEDQR